MDEIYVLTYNGAFVYDYHKGIIADGFKRVVKDWFDIEWEHSYRKMNYKKRDFKIKKFVFANKNGEYLLKCERVKKRNKVLRKALKFACEDICNTIVVNKDDTTSNKLMFKHYYMNAKMELKNAKSKTTKTK